MGRCVAYVAITKTGQEPSCFCNFGLKATNASIFGIGGQSNRFAGRLFGGIGIPLPITHGIVAVPSAGFTQEPRTVKNLGPNPPAGIPWSLAKRIRPLTLDYAVRFTQREKPHFSFDIGVGQVANNIRAIPGYFRRHGRRHATRQSAGAQGCWHGSQLPLLNRSAISSAISIPVLTEPWARV